jgi:predicted ATPase
MQGKKLLHSIRLTNLLSYGSEGVTLELEPLNVLIGPNASGKSNLIEAISLLAAAPRDLAKPLREGGGVTEWLWKGSEGLPTASVETVVGHPSTKARLRYLLSFTASRYRPVIEIEEIESFLSNLEPLYSFSNGEGRLRSRFDPQVVTVRDLSREQSIFSQRKDPANYPELTYLGDRLAQISFFRNWRLGRDTVVREAQAADLPNDFLLESASNLGLILNDLQNRLATKRLLMEWLRKFYAGIEDVTTKVQGNTIQIFFHEAGLQEPIPASRLSDGTLHYLCLLVILLHPEPPPLICIEEPELGLHPDILPKIADLLIDASQRTQLIVTTHSETLVSRLSEIPEAVVVCERDDQGTHLRRLEPDKLRAWLDKYMLGELWRMGEIGGNR